MNNDKRCRCWMQVLVFIFVMMSMAMGDRCCMTKCECMSYSMCILSLNRVRQYTVEGMDATADTQLDYQCCITVCSYVWHVTKCDQDVEQKLEDVFALKKATHADENLIETTPTIHATIATTDRVTTADVLREELTTTDTTMPTEGLTTPETTMLSTTVATSAAALSTQKSTTEIVQTSAQPTTPTVIPTEPQATTGGDETTAEQLESTTATGFAQLGLTELGWFRGLNNDWYKIYTTHAIYEDAVRECNSLGAQLVASGMRDPATRSAIRSKLTEHSDMSEIWIGLDDLVQESHHVWVDGVTATEDNTDWYEGEPNNYGGPENCVEIRKHYGWKFNDDECSKQQAYVCEIILQ